MGKKSEKKKDVALTKAQLQESVSKPLRFQDGEDGRVKQVTPPEEAAPATVQMTGVRDTAGITHRFLRVRARITCQFLRPDLGQIRTRRLSRTGGIPEVFRGFCD